MHALVFVSAGNFLVSVWYQFGISLELFGGKMMMMMMIEGCRLLVNTLRSKQIPAAFICISIPLGTATISLLKFSTDNT